MRLRYLILIVASFSALAGLVALVMAQAEVAVVGEAVCTAGLHDIWETASEACLSGPSGFICNGGATPRVEPAGPVSNALSPTGALVEVGVVESIRTPPLAAEANLGGVAWLRLPAPLNVDALMIGDVTVRDVSPPDFPAWQSFVLETRQSEVAVCGNVPLSALILESGNQTARVVVNGTSLTLSGAVLVQTDATLTRFITLSGQANLLASGQEQQMLIGQQASVPYAGGAFDDPTGPPSPPTPLDSALIQHLPVGLLKRPLALPQPGFVATEGQVNMRAAPSLDGALLAQIPAGETMSVLGRNPAGDWYHVQLASGLSGWIFADLLVKNTGEIQQVYEATPPPPQRFGEFANAAVVQAPAGVYLRQAPDVGFPIVGTLAPGTAVRLVARSPYSPWVKVDVAGTIGWVALITLQTEAFIDGLPVDFNVPPPPPPTVPPPPTEVPGSFGNAFPDPRGGG